MRSICTLDIPEYPGISYVTRRPTSVYFNAMNLIDVALWFYDRSGKSFPIQLEVYDVTFEGGIRARC